MRARQLEAEQHMYILSGTEGANDSCASYGPCMFFQSSSSSSQCHHLNGLLLALGQAGCSPALRGQRQ